MFSTKTWSIVDLVLRHLWETPGARFVIFAKAVKVLTDAGPWKLLTDYVLPEWIDANIGMQILTKNRQGVPGSVTDSKTRTIHLKVSNIYGGVSEVQLNSIQHDAEIDQKLLSTFYSGIWFSELRLWEDPTLYQKSRSRLRMPHLKPWQHLWVADTNPSKAGTKFWAYKLWYEKHKPPSKEMLELIGSELALSASEEVIKARHLIEWTMDDNIFASEEEKQARKLELADDPLEYQRDALGLWVAGDNTKQKLFAHIFSRGTHVIGVKDQSDPSRGQIKLSGDTEMLYSGWDLGSGVNHAAGNVEKRLVMTPKGEVSVFSVLSSLKNIDEHMKIQDFTLSYMEKKKTLEGRYPNRKFHWTHFSDDSAVNQPRSSGAGFDYLEVMIASHNEIVLTGVPKPKNSVGVRIRLIRQLLREGRLYISAECEDVIDMLEEAIANKDEEVEWNEHKHVFDWLSYVLYMLCFDELEERAQGPTANSPNLSISVPL